MYYLSDVLLRPGGCDSIIETGVCCDGGMCTCIVMSYDSIKKILIYACKMEISGLYDSIERGCVLCCVCVEGGVCVSFCGGMYYMVAIDHRMVVGRHLCNGRNQRLCKPHHVMIIRICLVQFDGCEFGVMSGRNTLVTKNSAEFVHSIKPSHHLMD